MRGGVTQQHARSAACAVRGTQRNGNMHCGRPACQITLLSRQLPHPNSNIHKPPTGARTRVVTCSVVRSAKVVAADGGMHPHKGSLLVTCYATPTIDEKLIAKTETHWRGTRVHVHISCVVVVQQERRRVLVVACRLPSLPAALKSSDVDELAHRWRRSGSAVGVRRCACIARVARAQAAVGGATAAVGCAGHYESTRYGASGQGEARVRPGRGQGEVGRPW